MGEVYRARDKRLERNVAIKILPSEVSSGPVRKQRFEGEAKTISNPNDPHICVLYDVGSQNGLDQLVMQCVEGETLTKRLEKARFSIPCLTTIRSDSARYLRMDQPAGILLGTLHEPIGRLLSKPVLWPRAAYKMNYNAVAYGSREELRKPSSKIGIYNAAVRRGAER